MKTALFILIMLILFISGCQRYSTPAAYPVPARTAPAAYSTTIVSTTVSTTSIFDCKSCQQGYICRQNQCVKVEFSNTGGVGSGGGGY